MAGFYDFSLVLDRNLRVQELRCPDREPYAGPFWRHVEGKTWTQLTGGSPLASQGEVTLDSTRYRYAVEDLSDRSLCLFRKKLDRQLYLERALDQLNEGVQIYDRDGNIVYFDPASRALLDAGSVERRRLLDLYDLKEEDSTVFTVLHTGAPIYNRFAHYYAASGRELVTVNNARPLYAGQTLLGVVNTEEDVHLVQRRAQRAREVQQAMKEKVPPETLSKTRPHYTFDDFVGSSSAIAHLKTLAARVAQQDSSVLLIGETGTGKEILAQSIHYASPRRSGPFVALNCAAVPDTLIESTLFGTARGSFTGGADRPGLLEEANHGTLFLDELNSMALPMQAKVLRAIQEGVFRRVGGKEDIRVDLRILSSCNQPAEVLLESGTLRRDLYYRLSAIVLELPPLRERLEDIPALVQARIQQNRRKYVLSFTHVDPATLEQMTRYAWPGNVRELFHAVDYAMNVADDAIFRPSYLPPYCRAQPQAAAVQGGTLTQQVAGFEQQAIRAALRACCGNVSQAARRLGLPRQGLQYRMRKYGITVE